SGGEQQRVAIARATAPRPLLLFADEPTRNLDATTGAGIVELIFGRAAETGATLVLITHDPSLAARCGRVIEMKDGRVVRDEVVGLRAMAGRDGGERVLAELKAVDTAYPLYGSFALGNGARLAPGTAAPSKALAERLNLRPGDRLSVGSATFRVAGIISSEPD